MVTISDANKEQGKDIIRGLQKGIQGASSDTGRIQNGKAIITTGEGMTSLKVGVSEASKGATFVAGKGWVSGGGGTSGGSRGGGGSKSTPFDTINQNIQDARFREASQQREQAQKEKERIAKLQRAEGLRQAYIQEKQRERQQYLVNSGARYQQERANLNRIKDEATRERLDFFYRNDMKQRNQKINQYFDYVVTGEKDKANKTKQRIENIKLGISESKKGQPKVIVGESQNIQDFYGKTREQDKTYNLILERAGQRRKLLDSEKRSLERIGLDKKQIKEISKEVKGIKEYSLKDIKVKNLNLTPSELSIINSKTSITPKAYRDIVDRVYKKNPIQIKTLFNTFKKTTKFLSPDIKGIPRRFVYLNEIIAGVGKSGLGLVKKSANYGRGLVIRAQQQKTMPIKILKQDLLKINKNMNTFRKFVQENPKTSLLIAGAFSVALAKSEYARFRKNPERYAIEQAVYTFGPSVLKLGAKTIGITRALEEAKFIGSTPRDIRPFVRQVIKGAKAQEKLTPYDLKSIKKINFSEVKSLNKTEINALKKALSLSKDAIIFGSLAGRTLSKGLTKIPKDVDLGVRNISQFAKKFISSLPKNERKNYIFSRQKIINTKTGAELFDIKPISRLRNKNGLPSSILKKGFKINIFGKKPLFTKKEVSFDVPLQETQRIKGVQLISFGEQTQRKALGTLQVLIERNKKRAKDPVGFIEALKIQREALKQKLNKNLLSRLNLVSRFNYNQINKAIKILESKKFQDVLESRVKGLSKEYPILKDFKLNNLKRLVKTAKNRRLMNKLNQKAKKTINKIKKAIKTTKSYLPKSKLPISRLPKSRLPKSRLPKSRLPRSRLPLSRTARNRLSKSRLQKPRLIKSRLPRSRFPSRLPVSRLPKSRLPISKIPKYSYLPKGRLPKPNKPPVIPKKIPKLWLTGKKKLPKGYVRSYDAFYKERGKIKRVRLNLPYNRALRTITRAIDNTTARSLQLRAVGITKKKDITSKNLMKFRAKSPRSKRTLRIVEKSKYAIDTRGEKRGLTLARYFKRGSRKVRLVSKRTKRRK